MIDEKFIFISSRGQIVEFSNQAPFILLNHDGIGAVKADVQMQRSPFQDGQTHTDSVLEVRSVSFTLLIQAPNQEELFKLRSVLVSALNPKLGIGTLKYVQGAIVREASATVELAPVFPSGESNRGPNFQLAMVSIICPDPYWLDTHTESDPLSAWLGGLRFPLRFPTSFATKSSAQIFNNDGDVPAPVEIIFHGPAKNPIVTNTTTGEFVRVNRTLGENDKLIVNTAFGNKSVQIEDEAGNRTNAFNWIDLDSTFWQLEVGYNEIEYSAESGTENATVQIIWRKRYVGV